MWTYMLSSILARPLVRVSNIINTIINNKLLIYDEEEMLEVELKLIDRQIENMVQSICRFMKCSQRNLVDLIKIIEEKNIL